MQNNKNILKIKFVFKTLKNSYAQVALLFNSTKEAIKQILQKLFQNIEEEYIFLNVFYCTSQHYIYAKTR